MTLRSALLAFSTLVLGYWIGWGHGHDMGLRDAETAALGAPSVVRVADEDAPPSPRMEMCNRIIGEVEAELLSEERLLSEF